MPDNARLVILFAFAGACGLAGCDNEFPPEQEVGSISGTVFYTGDAHASFARPAIQIAAFPVFPPQSAPHASQTIEDASFGPDGDGYVLTHLPSYDYFVVANVIDLDDLGNLTTPAGGFPDFCALSDSGGNVEVTIGATIEDVDITIYDQAGAEDPCNAVADDVCPEDGRATIALDIVGSISDFGAGDQVIFGLFTEWPAMTAPVRFAVVLGADVNLPDEPISIIDNAVPPGQYAVFVCFDRGSDSLMTCGVEDTQGLIDMGSLIDFNADKIIEIELDIGTGMHLPVVESDPSEFMCP